MIKSTKKFKWEVYIIQAENGNLYTGITTDIGRRLKEHQERNKGAKFFNISRPSKLLYQESHPNRSSALKREMQIKKMTRSEKLLLTKSR